MCAPYQRLDLIHILWCHILLSLRLLPLNLRRRNLMCLLPLLAISSSATAHCLRSSSSQLLTHYLLHHLAHVLVVLDTVDSVRGLLVLRTGVRELHEGAWPVLSFYLINCHRYGLLQGAEVATLIVIRRDHHFVAIFILIIRSQLHFLSLNLSRHYCDCLTRVQLLRVRSLVVIVCTGVLLVLVIVDYVLKNS